jgi:hypothetical protein
MFGQITYQEVINIKRISGDISLDKSDNRNGAAPVLIYILKVAWTI